APGVPRGRAASERAAPFIGGIRTDLSPPACRVDAAQGPDAALSGHRGRFKAGCYGMQQFRELALRARQAGQRLTRAVGNPRTPRVPRSLRVEAGTQGPDTPAQVDAASAEQGGRAPPPARDAAAPRGTSPVSAPSPPSREGSAAASRKGGPVRKGVADLTPRSTQAEVDYINACTGVSLSAVDICSLLT
ncbi:MAG: hypothetical protein M1823_007514, partial [Watsoniomyces obsoletus]